MSGASLGLALLLSLTLLQTGSTYRFKCLNDCTCDTEDEAIHCHNLNLAEVPLPENGARLRGFTVFGLTGNNIERLPSETTLTKAYPDLMAIDIEGNGVYDCSKKLNFRKIKVFSSCNTTGQDRGISRPDRIVPLLGDSTDDCNIRCQAEKHYEKLHLYLERVWHKLKTALRQFDGDRFVEEVKDFFRKHFGKNELFA